MKHKRGEAKGERERVVSIYLCLISSNTKLNRFRIYSPKELFHIVYLRYTLFVLYTQQVLRKLK